MITFLKGTKKFAKHILSFWKRKKYPHVDKTARVSDDAKVYNPNNLYMEEMTNIDAGAVIMNTRANVVFKKNSGAAFGLTTVTGNHMSVVGFSLKQITDSVKDKLDINHEMDKDIVVEEDVWIGNRVTLLSGVRIGRGAIVGAGSVVRGNVPPYAVVIGNPCKVVSFRFTPAEIVEHEKKQYKESDRLSIEIVQKNYEKYFLKRLNDIKQFTKI